MKKKDQKKKKIVMTEQSNNLNNNNNKRAMQDDDEMGHQHWDHPDDGPTLPAKRPHYPMTPYQPIGGPSHRGDNSNRHVLLLQQALLGTNDFHTFCHSF